MKKNNKGKAVEMIFRAKKLVGNFKKGLKKDSPGNNSFILIIVLSCAISITVSVIYTNRVVNDRMNDLSEQASKSANAGKTDSDIEEPDTSEELPYADVEESYSILLIDGATEEPGGLREKIHTLVHESNSALSELGKEPFKIENYNVFYDGSTVTIKLKQFENYICNKQLNDEDRSYIIDFLARLMDLEAGAGSLSNKEEKIAVGIVFLIRVDTYDESFENVFSMDMQYGSIDTWDTIDIPSDESYEAAEEAFEQFQSGSIDVPEWLWCQGMNIWGDIYQISFQYPEIEGQSPQFFTHG